MSSTSDPTAPAGSSMLPAALPESILAARRRVERAREEEEARKKEWERKGPVFDAYHEIFKQSNALGSQADEARQSGYAKLLFNFGKEAMANGYADNIRALNVDNCRFARQSKHRDWVSIAIDLVKSALAGDEGLVLALMRYCPSVERWDVVFNDGRLLDLILDPKASSTDHLKEPEAEDEKTESEDASLEKLAEELLPLDYDSADWILSKQAAKQLGVTTETLANKRWKGQKAKKDDESYGLHDKYCFWRKRGNRNPRYNLPLMKKHAGQLVKVFPKSTGAH